MAIYSGVLSMSSLGEFILGSEYLALEESQDTIDTDNVIVTYLGEEWVANRLADLNSYNSLYIGWGNKFNLTTGRMSLNIDGTNGIISRSSGSFIDDGFKPDMDITLSGFLNIYNNSHQLIDSVTDTEISIIAPFNLQDELGGGNEKIDVYINKSNVALFNEIDERNKCVAIDTEFSGDDTIYKVTGILTAPDTRIIREIGLFDAKTNGNLIAHAVFDDYNLNIGDSVTFVLALNPE